MLKANANEHRYEIIISYRKENFAPKSERQIKWTYSKVTLIYHLLQEGWNHTLSFYAAVIDKTKGIFCMT